MTDIATTQFNLCNGLLVPRQIISRHTSLLDSPTDDLEQSLDILEAVGSLFEMVIEDGILNTPLPNNAKTLTHTFGVESTQRDVIMDGVLPLLCKVVDHLYLLSIQQTEDDAMVEDDTADHKRQIMSLVKMYCVLVILSTLNGMLLSFF